MAGLTSTLETGRAFLSGKQLPTAARPARAAQPAPIQIQAAGAVTKKLKAGTAKAKKATPPRKSPPKGGTQRLGGGTQAFNGGGTLRIGTQPAKKLISIATNSKEKKFRPRVANSPAAPKLLARVEQLRLLSKLEDLKLLSLLERNGITLTFIEQSGLLETAESLGLLSAAADRNTPGLLFAAAFALYALAPAAVYFLPDSSTGLVAAQAAIVGLSALGGTAAFAGGSLLSTLQKEVS